MRFDSLSIVAALHWGLGGLEINAQPPLIARSLPNHGPDPNHHQLQKELTVGITEHLNYIADPPFVTRKLGSKTGKGGKGACKRHTMPKDTEVCKKKNPDDGLQDLIIAAPDPNLGAAAIGRCAAALQSSGYSEYDFENYSKWIHDDTTMMLADTGFWKGVDGIREYVQTALTPGPCESKPFLSNVFGVNGTASLLPITAVGDACTLLTTTKVTFQNRCLFPGDLDTIMGLRYSFNIVDDTSSAQATIHMKRIDIYTPPGMLGFIATQLKSEEYAKAMCQTMMTSCPETFEYNCYNAPGETFGIDKCVGELLSLPATDNDGPSFNGKSFACRFLHSIFARTNENHCGHTSFDPQYDSKCFTKCQQAAGVTNADMFHPIELGFLAGEAAKHGLPVEQWKYVE